MGGTGMRQAVGRRSGNTPSCDQRDVEGRRSIASLPARNRKDPSPISRSIPTCGLRDIETDAGPSAQRRVPKADIGDLCLPNARRQHARLLIRIESIMRKFEIDQPNGRNPHAEGAAFPNTLQAQ